MSAQPNVYNSLAEYARAKGVKPATVRQWKRRGLLAIADGKVIASPALPVTERDSAVVTARDNDSEPVTQRDNIGPSVTPCDKSSVAQCDKCAQLVTERDSLQARIDQIVTERDNLSAQIADLVTERDSLRERCEFLSAREMVLSSEVAGLILDGSPGYDIVEYTDAVADQTQRIDDCAIDLAPDWGA